MMSSEIHFLPATAEDYEEVDSISGGIYKGKDYLPTMYHEWLKDPCRRMFLAKCEGKVVGFESFLLVDDGVTAVLQALRVAPWIRGRGVAGMIQQFCIDILRSEHPEVKRVCLTHAEDPPSSMLKKYKVIHSKAVIPLHLPSDQLEGALKLLENRLDNFERSKNHLVLEPTEVLTFFEGTKREEELLPGKRLIQGWLPLTTHRANLERLIEQNVSWMYSSPRDTSVFLANANDTYKSQPGNDPDTSTISSVPAYPHSSERTSSSGFLSLRTPSFLIPYAKGAYRIDIDMFGNDPVYAKTHVLQQLKMGIQGLPATSDIICMLYAEKSLLTELNQLCEGLVRFSLMREQIVLEMDI